MNTLQNWLTIFNTNANAANSLAMKETINALSAVIQFFLKFAADEIAIGAAVGSAITGLLASEITGALQDPPDPFVQNSRQLESLVTPPWAVVSI